MSNGSVDLSSYVTLSYLQTGYHDKTKTETNLNNAISNLSSVYSTKTETNTAISNLSSVYLSQANASLLYAPIGSGSGNTNISFGSVNLATFATSKSIILPVTGVSGIVTSATKINYGTGLSTTI